MPGLMTGGPFAITSPVSPPPASPRWICWGELRVTLVQREDLISTEWIQRDRNASRARTQDPVKEFVSPSPPIKVAVSPSGGAGATTAVKVTTCPERNGFGEDDSVVVVLVLVVIASRIH